MLNQVRPGVVLFLALTIITGVVYPLVITGVSRLIFRDKASGSILVGSDGAALGSALIGQEFGTSDREAAPRLAGWFWGRPSATTPVAYTSLNLEKGTASGGSNLAPTNPALLENVTQRLEALRAADESAGLFGRTEPVPVDLLTASASGLDPDISVPAAEYQAPRVARVRGLTREAVLAAVREHTQRRALGVFGEPVVKVLELNLALERASRGARALR